MKEKISILEFIKTGRFGDVGLGMNSKEVIALLGEPDSTYDSEDAGLFAYGRWEIHFLKNETDSAFLIYNDQLLYDCANHDEMVEFENHLWKVELDFIKPFQHIRLKQVTQLLDEQKIKYELVNKPYQPILQLESKVYMDFTDTEPVSEKSNGVFWGPGRKQDLQSGEKRIENSEDLILYTIGICNM